MSVDKFGRHEDFAHRKRSWILKQNGFPITHNGNYDLNNRPLHNVGAPIIDNDAVNLQYVKANCLTKISGNERPGSNKESNVCYDASNCKITNVGDGIHETDAVNLRTLEREVRKLMNEHELKLERLGSTIFKYVHRQVPVIESNDDNNNNNNRNKHNYLTPDNIHGSTSPRPPTTGKM